MQITRTHKIVCENFETKNLGQYHDLYVQIDALFWADVFEKFRDMCHKIYELDPTHFYAASGLVWQVSLKKDKSKTRSFNWYLFVINGRKRYERRHMSLYKYPKASNKYMTGYDKNKE